MAARYWKRLIPELALPTAQEPWTDFVAWTSARTSRGTSLARLLRNVPTSDINPKKEGPELTLEDLTLGALQEEETESAELETVKVSNLIVEPRTPKSINDLRSAIEDVNPPIPQILVFDRMMMTRRIEGGYHAVVLLKLDFDKEKLYVVDPTLTKRMEPDIYDFDNFSRGWQVLSNLNICVYPDGMTIIAGPDRSILEYARRIAP
jgi:hypothetical protein